MLGVDEDGENCLHGDPGYFRYNTSLCDFVAYHWVRDAPGGIPWWTAPVLAETVSYWKKRNMPVLVNEDMCYISPENLAIYGTNGWEYNTSQPLISEMLHTMLADGSGTCFHSVWGAISEVPGWMTKLM